MNDWTPSGIRYMQPRKNDRGGSAITVISVQSNRILQIAFPMLMTWGISDYTDEKGESDGKYTMSLQFPRDTESTPETEEALSKLKEFEQKLLADGVVNSKAWFGKQKTAEVVEDNYFSFLKYTKNKETGEYDTSKPPILRPKVPNYDGKWKVEIFDTTGTQIFPCEEEDATPIDFVPKRSNVMCVIQCGGIWCAGGKWGLTWKLQQSVVKPQEMESVLGSGLKLELTPDMKAAINRDIPESIEAPVEEKKVKAVVSKTPESGAIDDLQTMMSNLHVEDSDDEPESESKPEPEPEPEPESKPEPEPEPEPVKAEPVKTVKKKMVKKAKS